MAYDLDLAERVRDSLAAEPDLTERKMFGGLAFLIRGHLTVVVSSKGGLMLRADPDTTTELVESGAAEFAEMRGRPMKGWLRVGAADVRSEADLAVWVDRSVSYSATLPPKA